MNTKNKLTISAVALSIVAASAAANAAPATDSALTPYVGVELGGLSVPLEDGLSDYFDESFFVGGIYAGADITKNWGVEFGYNQTTTGDKTNNGISTELDYSLVYGDVVGNYALNDQIDLIGSVGIAYATLDADITAGVYNATVDGNETGVKLGLGSRYNFNDDWALRAKGDYIDVADGLYKYTLGLEYRF